MDHKGNEQALAVKSRIQGYLQLTVAATCTASAVPRCGVIGCRLIVRTQRVKNIMFYCYSHDMRSLTVSFSLFFGTKSVSRLDDIHVFVNLIFFKSGIYKSTEWSKIPACPSRMCFFNRGDTEGTNSSKILCPMFVYVLFYVNLCHD